MKRLEKNRTDTGVTLDVYRSAFRREQLKELGPIFRPQRLGPLLRPQRLDSDVMMALGIIAFIAFLGIAAVGFYAGLVSRLI